MLNYCRINAKLLPELGEWRVKVSRNVTDNCRYSNLFLFLCVYDVCVCLCMVFTCDVSGVVPVYQGEKPRYFSVAYNMIQEIMS